jgi:hypothetical protein
MSTRRSAPHAVAAIGCALAITVALAGCAPSLAPGTRECLGFPAEVCQGRVADLEEEGQAHRGVVAYHMICTAATCTAASGEGREAVVFGDGTGREGGFGYATPVDPPPGAAAPTLGVPASWCMDVAASAATEAVREGGSVVSVTVACTSPCTETAGTGNTSVTLSDGRVIRSSWEYKTSSGQ